MSLGLTALLACSLSFLGCEGDDESVEDSDNGGANAGDDLLMENVTSWVTSGFTIRDSFGNHLQTVNGVS